MLRFLLILGLVLTPPSNAHISINLESEFDDSYTSDVDPYAPRGLKASYLSSVSVQTFDSDIPKGMGSGNYFKLGKHRFIITAAHVVEGSDSFQILEKGFSMTDAEVVYFNKDTDIAVLVPKEKLKYTKAIPFRRDISNQIGEKVYHCGHPAREGFHISEGILTSTNNDVLMINTFAWPGSSGSVVFDESGRVIGVLSAIRVDGPFGIPTMVEHIVLSANIKTLDQDTLKEALRSNE